MAMGVDEARKERLALAVDQLVVPRHSRRRLLDDVLDTAIVVDQQRSEMLQLPVRPNLKAVDVADEDFRGGGRSEKERGQREQGLTHRPRHSIVRSVRKV